MRPFHLAFPVRDLEETRAFYVGKLGCGTGREDTHWIDFDLYGHQVVAHLDPSLKDAVKVENKVDGADVPVPHFGVVLTMEDWASLRARLEHDPDIRWIISPRVRFKGEPGEQATMFLADPSGNALEFKAFADDRMLFAK